MRARNRCTKCDHGEVLHVPSPVDADRDRMAIGGLKSVWSGEANGALEAFVCTKCGYTELYLREPKALDIAKLDGARVLEADATSEPYR